MSQFVGKVALITGGNAGIGRAAAIEFAKQGGKVVVSGRREKEGHEVIAETEAPNNVASKHAVNGLTKSVALEYAKQNVRVNAVAPGPIETRMYLDFAVTPEVRQMVEGPMGRIGQPEEIANTVVWLCSDGASFITGQILPVDGGYTAQ